MEIRSTGGVLKSQMQYIFGIYTPTGETIAQADWEYIASVLIFCIVLFFTLKIITGLFRSK